MEDITKYRLNAEQLERETKVAAVLEAYEQWSAPDVIFNTHRDNVYPEYAPDGVGSDIYAEALAELPARNPALGSEAYRAFAESGSPRDRREIVMYLTKLCLANRDTGLELWDHLVRDPDDEVRREAFNELDSEHLNGAPSLDPATYEDDERTRRDRIGLTWQDITHLYRAYLRAETAPLTRYQPGMPPQGAQSAPR